MALRPWIAPPVAVLLVVSVAACTSPTDEPTRTAPTPTSGPGSSGVVESSVPFGTPTPSAEARAFLWPAHIDALAGVPFEVAVWVNPGAHGVSSGELTVSYPAGACQVESVAPGALLGAEPLVGFQEIDNDAGTTRFAAARIGPTETPSSPGPLASLRMTCAEALDDRLGLEAAIADAGFEAAPLAGVEGAGLTVAAR